MADAERKRIQHKLTSAWIAKDWMFALVATPCPKLHLKLSSAVYSLKIGFMVYSGHKPLSVASTMHQNNVNTEQHYKDEDA